MGLQEGAESRFPVNLPDDFANPLLAGKSVEFEVKIHEVKRRWSRTWMMTLSRAWEGIFKGWLTCVRP